LGKTIRSDVTVTEKSFIMDLYVLEVPTHADNTGGYRGVDRYGPTFCESLPADHEINRLFSWYVEPDGGGPVHDLAKAHRYAELCNLHFRGSRFEVVEVTKGQTPPEANGIFIGFDLFGYGGSLIAMGALTARSRPDSNVVPEHVSVLCEVVSEFFRLKLNSYALFEEFETAAFCLRSLDALQRLRPGMYESENPDDLSGCEVVGIYMVSTVGKESDAS
jgi:hypothetical protein